MRGRYLTHTTRCADNTHMPTPLTLILHSGGLRSLVATALAAAESDKPRLTLLHLIELKPNAAARLEHARRQAEHFGIKRLVELDLPRIAPGLAGATGPKAAPVPSPMARSQMLVTALAQAAELHAERVIWPAQFDGDVRHAAHATELTVLATHLAETELELSGRPAPRLDTPLAELTDKQLVELGGQLDAPWALAWSCQMHGDAPCHACEPCRRRRHAFESAGVIDPIDGATVR
jgi:7-cyano-7-deazaguanine synthase